MSTLSTKQLFVLAFVAFCALLFTSLVYAWTGPTAAPPSNNVDAPINVGTASQIKEGVIGVDGLAVFGTTYIQTKLGINDDTPVVALDVAGTVRLGNGGEVCQAVTEGAVRYNTTSNQIEVCNGTSWGGLGGTKYLNITFSDASKTSTGSFTMPEAGSGLLTVYANVCVPNNQATTVTLTVDGVDRNTALHRDAAASGGADCSVEVLTYHGSFSEGAHTVVITISGSGQFTSAGYLASRIPAVQGHILYPIQ